MLLARARRAELAAARISFLLIARPPAAFDRGQVHVVFLGQLTHQRRAANLLPLPPGEGATGAAGAAAGAVALGAGAAGAGAGGGVAGAGGAAEAAAALGAGAAGAGAAAAGAAK